MIREIEVEIANMLPKYILERNKCLAKHPQSNPPAVTKEGCHNQLQIQSTNKHCRN